LAEATGQPGIGPSWRGVVLIACTYIYFLIFAQFGFLKRLTELGLGEALTPVMGAMAAGGVLASLFGQQALRRWGPATRLRAGLLGCALAAALSTATLRPPAAGCVAALIGLALGLLTVTLVSHLRLWAGQRNPLFTVALGTGLGYFACNVPWLFNATPSVTAWVSGLGCLLALGATHAAAPDEFHFPWHAPVVPSPPFGFALLAFTALIWLDSAAFFIIQNSPELKAGTWQGTLHLWQNGAIHILAALVSFWLLRRFGLLTTLLSAFGCIAAAGMLLHDPTRASLASFFYPAGVSLYSVALVAHPSLLLSSRSIADRERQAGLIYAIAGWIGSAMGIGMAQHLHHIPTLFITMSGLAIVAPWLWPLVRRNMAPVAAAIGVAAFALLLQKLFLPGKPPASPDAASQIALGRQVYIAEGCIHCHSQYIRPRDRADVTLWGPAQDVETIRQQRPPLIGNRRQGPDLSEVGSRRSALWLRMHFMDPRAISDHSIMPSYDYLFAGSRGDSLVAYVSSLRTPDAPAHLGRLLTTWTPSATATETGHEQGEKLFQEHCATCHVATGAARFRWGASFHPLPPNLFRDNLPLLPPARPSRERELTLERIIKFGVPGTNMPGHEYLPDAQIVDLAAWLIQTRAVMSSSNSARSVNLAQHD